MKFRNKKTKQVVIATTDHLDKLYRINPEYEEVKEKINKDNNKEK